MVNRYSITGSPYQYAKEDVSWEAQYNACPTQKLPVLVKENQVEFMNWGLMVKMTNNKSTSSKLFNTPVNQVFTKASTKTAMKSRRCIILADGIFLWKQIGKKKQTPYYFYQDNQQLFGMAGYWESSEDLEGHEFQCFMLITGSHPQLSDIQDDSPLFLQPSEFKNWLDPNADQDQLNAILDKGGATRFASHAVSPAIQNDELNHAGLISPTTPSDQHGNYTLF